MNFKSAFMWLGITLLFVGVVAPLAGYALPSPLTVTAQNVHLTFECGQSGYIADLTAQITLISYETTGAGHDVIYGTIVHTAITEPLSLYVNGTLFTTMNTTSQADEYGTVGVATAHLVAPSNGTYVAEVVYDGTNGHAEATVTFTIAVSDFVTPPSNPNLPSILPSQPSTVNWTAFVNYFTIAGVVFVVASVFVKNKKSVG